MQQQNEIKWLLQKLWQVCQNLGQKLVMVIILENYTYVEPTVCDDHYLFVAKLNLDTLAAMVLKPLFCKIQLNFDTNSAAMFHFKCHTIIQWMLIPQQRDSAQ